MRYLVKCGWRIGDILMQFPALRHLADLGHQVFAYCQPQYRTLFDLVSYATHVERPSACVHDRHLDLQIYPDRQPDFKESGLRLVEYVYGLYPEIRAALGRDILFDREEPLDPGAYGLPSPYFLLSPFGYSQALKPTLEWMVQKFASLVGHGRNLFILSDKEIPGCPYPLVIARTLSHLPGLIRNAAEFFTVNSSPSIIASVVRERYYHLYQPDWDGTHDWKSPKQHVIYHEDWPKPRIRSGP